MAYRNNTVKIVILQLLITGHDFFNNFIIIYLCLWNKNHRFLDKTPCLHYNIVCPSS